MTRSCGSSHSLSPGLTPNVAATADVRGQPAAELRETLAALREENDQGPVLALVAPAFPATGRTVRTDETGAANVARMLTGALLGLHLTWQATGHEQGLHEEVEYFWRTIAPVLIAPSEYEALELSRPA